MWSLTEIYWKYFEYKRSLATARSPKPFPSSGETSPFVSVLCELSIWWMFFVIFCLDHFHLLWWNYFPLLFLLKTRKISTVFFATIIWTRQHCLQHSILHLCKDSCQKLKMWKFPLVGNRNLKRKLLFVIYKAMFWIKDCGQNQLTCCNEKRVIFPTSL